MSTADLETCISCGLCLNDCPTFRVLGDESDSPRGRIQLIKAMVAAPLVAPEPAMVEHLEACIVCRACETACPSGVPFGRIMEDARAVIGERASRTGRARLVQRLGLGIVTRPRLLIPATLLGTLYVRSGLRAVFGRLLPRRLALAQSLIAPREGGPYAPVARDGATAGFFAGCLMRAAYGDTDRATVRLLERAGHVVTAPAAQGCCGALHAHAGDAAGARALARVNVGAFAGGDTPIVVNAAGCGAHLKAYGHVLADDPAWSAAARAFALRVRDVSEVLPVAAQPATGGPSAGTAGRPLRVVYQDACHLAHGQKIRSQPRALLAAVPGVTVVAIADPDRCCGSGGVYNLTHAAVAGVLAREKAEAIIAARPDVVVSGNPGCMLQVAAALRSAGSDVPVVHLTRFLDDPAEINRVRGSAGQGAAGYAKMDVTR
ncbi:MAG: 4Fe-4S dicluster domain-containing protein [Chloroflexi bacterium]|nr:4Fe-4S dicluster domain-containing protein [Chloroflexota bacterium]